MKKQIEEMARKIFESRVAVDGFDIAFAGVHGADREDSNFMRIAGHLHRNGYRKATEVAEEIFAEIEASISLFSFHCDEDTNYEWGVHDALVWVDEKIAELKKKYTEVQTDGT